MRKRALIISGLVIAIFVSACGQRSQNQASSSNEVVTLNSAPQKEYPEFTLEQQKAAMQILDESRRKKRVDGLRDKIPPADWIQIAYHGLVLDANLDVIELTPDTISKIQESMFSIVQASAREKTIERYGSDLRELFDSEQLQDREKPVVRSAVLDALLAESDQTVRERYEWRHRLISKGPYSQTDRNLILAPPVTELLKRRGFREDLFDKPPAAPQYIDACRAEGVPIPPNWPDPRWISQGALNFVFISGDLDAEVFAFKDSTVPGVCYALPRRRRDNNSIQLLGIICQSERTGKVCFWDNKEVDNTPIVGPDIRLEIATIGNGWTLRETCTNCHRGDNAFNIHPGTPLQLNRAGAPGGPYDTDPAVRYTPIGQAHWSNPGPLMTLPTPPAGQMPCTSCHRLPELSPDYCISVMQPAALTTMPPFGTIRAGWPPGPLGPLFADHTGRLAANCPP